MSLPAKLTLALVTLIAGATAFVVYSAGGTEHRAAEVDEMAFYGLEEREGATRMRLLVVDADYGLGPEGFEGDRQDFDTYVERIDGIVNEIAINNPRCRRDLRRAVRRWSGLRSGSRVPRRCRERDAVHGAHGQLEQPQRDDPALPARTTRRPDPGWRRDRIALPHHRGDWRTCSAPTRASSLLERFFVQRSSLTEAIINVGDERVLISVMDLLGTSPMPTRTAENEDAFAQLLVRRVDGVNLGARGPFEIRTEDQVLSIVRDPNVDVLRSAIDSNLQGRVTSPVISAELGFVEAVVLDPSQMVNRTGPRMEIFIDENGTRIEYPEQVEGSGAPTLVNVQDLLGGSGQGAPEDATPPEEQPPSE